MNHITDYVAIVAVAFFFWQGWNKGLWETLSGPLIIAASILGGSWYFFRFGQLLVSIAIAVIVPIVLKIILGIMAKITDTKKSNNPQDVNAFGSTIAGSLNAVWGAVIFAGILVGVMVIPIKNENLAKAQKDIRSSQTYSLMQAYCNNYLPKDASKETPIATKIVQALMSPLKNILEKADETTGKIDFIENAQQRRIQAAEDAMRTY